MLALLSSFLYGAPGKRSGDDQGKRIYLKQCAHCHGMQGEGVVGVNENPLYGNKQLSELIQVIVETMPEDKPNAVIERLLRASSFKLNWIVDPFARTGGIGIVAKKMGRRFIGFEVDKDKLVLAMKRIDSE